MTVVCFRDDATGRNWREDNITKGGWQILMETDGSLPLLFQALIYSS